MKNGEQMVESSVDNNIEGIIYDQTKRVASPPKFIKTGFNLQSFPKLMNRSFNLQTSTNNLITNLKRYVW